MAVLSVLLPVLLALAAYETRALPSSPGPAPAPSSGGAPAPPPPPSHWDYTTMDKWANDPAYAKCGEGKHQSPVNIDAKTIKDDENDVDGFIIKHDEAVPLTFAEGSCQGDCWTILNNGHAIQLSPKAPYYSVMDGKLYKLLQMHFHTPSEHWIDSNFMPLELHFVHQSPSDGQYMVVGIMFDYDENAPTPFLDVAQKYLPFVTEAGTNTTINETVPYINLLQNNLNKGYYTYNGSLTTPPCTEGIRWIVLRSTATVRPLAWNDFRASVGYNARIVVPRDPAAELEPPVIETVEAEITEEGVYWGAGVAAGVGGWILVGGVALITHRAVSSRREAYDDK